MDGMAQSFDLTNGINVLRIICGLFFVPHLVVKFRNQEFVKDYMAKVGMNPPIVWLYSAFAIEIACTIGLVFNILTLYAALLGGVFLVAAAWASWRHSDGKWIWNFGGAEYPLFWGICCFIIAIEA